MIDPYSLRTVNMHRQKGRLASYLALLALALGAILLDGALLRSGAPLRLAHALDADSAEGTRLGLRALGLDLLAARQEKQERRDHEPLRILYSTST